MRRLVLLIALAASIDVRADDEPGYEVIVHPKSTATEVDKTLLRDAYLKRAIEWPDGTTLHPIGLSARFPVHDRFVRDVIGKTPAQLRNYWNQQIFSGKAVPPPEVDSIDAEIEYVIGHPGAVGYLPAGTDAKGARVVHVR
jgi:hypothetical protein